MRGRGRRGGNGFSVLKNLDGSILISWSRYNIILVIREIHNCKRKRWNLHLVGHFPQVALSHIDQEYLNCVIFVDQIVEISLFVWGEETSDGGENRILVLFKEVEAVDVVGLLVLLDEQDNFVGSVGVRDNSACQSSEKQDSNDCYLSLHNIYY